MVIYVILKLISNSVCDTLKFQKSMLMSMDSEILGTIKALWTLLRLNLMWMILLKLLFYDWSIKSVIWVCMFPSQFLIFSIAVLYAPVLWNMWLQFCFFVVVFSSICTNMTIMFKCGDTCMVWKETIEHHFYHNVCSRKEKERDSVFDF